MSPKAEFVLTWKFLDTKAISRQIALVAVTRPSKPKAVKNQTGKNVHRDAKYCWILYSTATFNKGGIQYLREQEEGGGGQYKVNNESGDKG